MEKIHLNKFIKGEYSVYDVFQYFLGNFRYILYYSRFKFLIRNHIRDQIDLRIRMMDKECYNRGSCKICGCRTTHLQMANKSCEGNCYPTMMNRKEWKFFIGKEKNMYSDPLYFGWGAIGGYKSKDRSNDWLNKNEYDTPLEDISLIKHYNFKKDGHNTTSGGGGTESGKGVQFYISHS